MAICNVVKTVRVSLFATAAVMLAAAFPARAHAQDASATPPPVVAAAPTPAPATGPRMVGGHVGAAVPVVSFHSVGKDHADAVRPVDDRGADRRQRARRARVGRRLRGGRRQRREAVGQHGPHDRSRPHLRRRAGRARPAREVRRVGERELRPDPADPQGASSTSARPTGSSRRPSRSRRRVARATRSRRSSPTPASRFWERGDE